MRQIGLIVGLLLSLATVSAQATDEVGRQQVIALFLYNFANFAQWPDDAFASVDAPLKICILDGLEQAHYLDAVDGTLVGSRPLSVFRAKRPEQVAEGCQILFISQRVRASLPDFWRHVQCEYLLSVGEQEAFAERGGVINIMRQRDQYTFDINIATALDAGLFIDAELLSLARQIKRHTRFPVQSQP